MIYSHYLKIDSRHPTVFYIHAPRNSTLQSGAGRLEGQVGKLAIMAMKIRNHKGQNVIEYAMVAAIVTAAVVAMSTYVFRSVQAAQQSIQKEFRSQN